jgi:hypothetical protein
MLWWRSREHRQLVIYVTVESAGKGPRGRRSAPEFQRQSWTRWSGTAGTPMRGPVALDLHFGDAQRNPPGIHRAVKHTLDLLGPALPGTERPRRRPRRQPTAGLPGRAQDPDRCPRAGRGGAGDHADRACQGALPSHWLPA